MKLPRPPCLRSTWPALVAFGVACLAAGCQSPESNSGTTPPLESSVRPGINEDYLKPDLDVDTWVQRLERETREVYRQRQAILGAMAIRPGQDVADIGAGTGIFVPLLAQAVGSDGLVYAVDVVPEFLNHIEAQADQRGWGNVLTVLCTERSVTLPEHSIDLALACDVYHHFEYPRSSLASLRQALRENGELVVIDFKRIPGESSDWVLEHVRAGQEVVTREIEEAGFRKIAEYPILQENYMIRFRKLGD